MFIREYDRYSPEPCYILASHSRWQRGMKDGMPHSPADLLALLNPENMLHFQLLKYQNASAVSRLNESLEKAQYRQYDAGHQTGVSESDRHTLRRVLQLLNGAQGTVCCGYYIGAVICRCRTSRNELTIILGSVKEDAYRTVRLVDISGELHLRFTGRPFSRYKVEAVDFHLSPNSQTERFDLRVREHWNIHQDLSVYPWIMRDGHAISNATKNSCCRDIQLSQGRLSRHGSWLMPTQEYFGVRFESLDIL